MSNPISFSSFQTHQHWIWMCELT